MIIGILIGIFVLLVLVVAFGYGISIYNSFVRLKNNIEKAWSNIDVLLKQRQDELTKLLETVKGYAKHEKTVLTQVTQARSALQQMGKARGVKAKAKADNFLSSTLKSLFAVTEAYPDLKADKSFISFQNRITGIEESISDRREFYNDSVNTYNIRLDTFPDLIIARILGYTSKELFQATEADRKDVKVEF